MISASMAEAGFRDALRLFQSDAAALRDPGPSLETNSAPPEPPRVVSSDVIESTTLRTHRIADPPVVGFEAFLDGAQESRVVHYCDGVPVVFGRVAAVVRQRVLRRMITWKRPETRSRFYIPRSHVPAELWTRVVARGFDPFDTTEPQSASGSADATSDPHPFTLAQHALEAVKRD